MWSITVDGSLNGSLGVWSLYCWSLLLYQPLPCGSYIVEPLLWILYCGASTVEPLPILASSIDTMCNLFNLWTLTAFGLCILSTVVASYVLYLVV